VIYGPVTGSRAGDAWAAPAASGSPPPTSVLAEDSSLSINEGDSLDSGPGAGAGGGLYTEEDCEINDTGRIIPDWGDVPDDRIT